MNVSGDGIYYLKSRKKAKKFQGFRGFKLKSWNRNDYRNMMITQQLIQNRITSSNSNTRPTYDRGAIKSSKSIRRYHYHSQNNNLNETIKSVQDVSQGM